MSLFRSPLRPPLTSSDEAVRRYLLSIRAGIEPDPLFRRHLRGLVVNRHVAVREGLDARPATKRSRARAMGPIGRGCLYASVALTAGIGGTMAASQGALPGDGLYPIKRQVEALRLQALPTQFHDDLAVYMLSERIHEMTRLIQAGDGTAAAGLAAIEAGYARLAKLGVGAGGSDVLQARMVVLQALLQRLPTPTQAALERMTQPATTPIVDPAREAAPSDAEPVVTPRVRPVSAPPQARVGADPVEWRRPADELPAATNDTPPAHDGAQELHGVRPVE